MVNGMEILNQSPVYEFGKGFAIALGITISLSIILGVIVGLQEMDVGSGLQLFGLCLFAAFIISILIGNATMEPTEKNTYEVIFHEPVDIYDLTEKYEIKDVNGKIITLEEK